MSHSIDGDDDSAVCRVLSPNSLSLVPVKLEECFVVDTAFDPRGFDPRTEDSVPSVLPDDATATGADVAVEAAETRLTARAVRELLAALGGSIGDEDELVVLLQRAVEIANDAIDGADSIGVTIDLAGQTYTAVHTDSRTLRVDIEQYDAGDGPCLHAARTGETVVVDAETSAERWPRFAAAAKDERDQVLSRGAALHAGSATRFVQPVRTCPSGLRQRRRGSHGDSHDNSLTRDRRLLPFQICQGGS